MLRHFLMAFLSLSSGSLMMDQNSFSSSRGQSLVCSGLSWMVSRLLLPVRMPLMPTYLSEMDGILFIMQVIKRCTGWGMNIMRRGSISIVATSIILVSQNVLLMFLMFMSGDSIKISRRLLMWVEWDRMRIALMSFMSWT